MDRETALADFDSARDEFLAALKAAPDEIIQMYEPKEINVVVVGGETQGAWKIFGANHVATVSVDAWR